MEIDFKFSKETSAFFEYSQLHFQFSHVLPVNFQIKCIELQSGIQLKVKCGHFSLLDFYKAYLNIEKYTSQSHLIHVITFWQYVHSWTIFSRMMHRKSKIRPKIWQASSALTNNHSHFHWARQWNQFHKNKVKQPTSFMVLLTFFFFNVFIKTTEK